MLPTGIEGCIYWFDATDSGSLYTNHTFTTLNTGHNSIIGGWYNKATSGNNAFQSNIDSKPILHTGAINGLNAIRFDGIDDCLTLIYTNGIGQAIEPTVFLSLVLFDEMGGTDHFPFLLGLDGSPANSFAFQTQGNTTNNSANKIKLFTLANVTGTLSDVAKFNTTKLWCVDVQDTTADWKLYSNNANARMDISGFSSSSILGDAEGSGLAGIGGSVIAGYKSSCYIGEVIAYSGILTASQRYEIFDYLRRWTGYEINPITGSTYLTIPNSAFTTGTSLNFTISGPIVNTGSMYLYTTGPISNSGMMNLTIKNSGTTGSLDLSLPYVVENISGNFYLYSSGVDIPSGVLPLTIRVLDPTPIITPSEIPSTGGSEFFGGFYNDNANTPFLPLTIRAISGIESGTCYLTIDGSGSLNASGICYLTLYGASTSINSQTLSLTVLNSGLEKSLNLYIRGAGTTPGSIPLTGGPLYLTINNQGYDNIIPITIIGQSTSNQSMDLSMSTNQPLTGQLHLSIPTVITPTGDDIPLFTRGF